MGLDIRRLRDCTYKEIDLKYKSIERLIEMFMRLQKEYKSAKDLNIEQHKKIENFKIKLTKKKKFI